MSVLADPAEWNFVWFDWTGGDARLSPGNRLVASAVKEAGLSLNNNPLITESPLDSNRVIASTRSAV